MQSGRDIKNRIGSINNTRQITKAMEVVAATKMRRSQELAIGLRPFAREAMRILESISFNELAPDNFWLTTRPIARRVVLVVTSDKGLAGSYNSNVLRATEDIIKKFQTESPVDVIAIGHKAKEYFDRRGYNVIKEYIGSSDFSVFDDISEIAHFLESKFIDNNFDALTAIYTHFQSTLRQTIAVRNILPMNRSDIIEMIKSVTHQELKHQSTNEEKIFEPSRQAVFETLLPYLFRLMLYHIILESNASEHSSRMVAMKKASDNAAEIMDDLTLSYNKSRQASITQELIEITSGFSAL